MEKRIFGKTGLETSLIGFGGFHLCEIPYAKAEELLNAYLDQGGNYVETAPSYGDGESEIKIGKAIGHRRDEFVLVTKAHERDYASCKATLEQSFKNLQTDYIDVLLMHAVGTMDILDEILGDGGAIEAAEEARAAGRIGAIGISMHGQPDVLIEAIERYPFKAVMTTINYVDVCNFPKINNVLVPLANKKGVAIILMKPVGDGYLYENIEPAFKYAFSQPVSVVVTGMNTMSMLEKDMALAESHTPITKAEEKALMASAPELNDYVCRQCQLCMPCPHNVDITENFRLEAIFDRQMHKGDVEDAAKYALQERLKHWFGTKDMAIDLYKNLDAKATNCTECGDCMPKCPYNIDIISKLKNVDYKLAPEYGRIWDQKTRF